MTVVFDYGPADKPKDGFQVQFTSRFSNAAGDTKELYYSNGGMINLDTNESPIGDKHNSPIVITPYVLISHHALDLLIVVSVK